MRRPCGRGHQLARRRPGGRGAYVSWGVVQISVTNLAIVAAMLVVFVVAAVMPLGRGREPGTGTAER